MFLEKDGSVSIRKRNFQILATNMYKESKGLSPSIIAEPFKHKGDQHNLRNIAEFTTPAITTVYHDMKLSHS